MKISIIGIALITSLFSFSAYSAPKEELKFCAENDVQKKISISSNRLSFKNQGGLANGGVCWWHSRFTRNANYVAVFSPEKAKPHNKTMNRPKKFAGKTPMKRVPAPGSVKYILKQIKYGKVVEIPGYKNLREFSKANRKEIQKLLGDWQIEDGFIKQSWVVGLMGKSKTTAAKFEKSMDKTFKRVSKGQAVYQKLQIKGVVAHAWIVTGMEKTRDGYNISVIDSNYSSTRIWRYKKGDTHFNYPGWGKFVPYTERTREEKKTKKAKEKFCMKVALGNGFAVLTGEKDSRDVNADSINDSALVTKDFSGKKSKKSSKKTGARKK